MPQHSTVPDENPKFQSNLLVRNMAVPEQSIIGGKDNFWLYTKVSDFDLIHPETPTSEPTAPRVQHQTSRGPIAIDPRKTALLPLDTQDYFLVQP
jgi:hypothetical protein